MKFIFGEVISFISDTAGRIGEFAKASDTIGGLSTWLGNRFKTQTTIIGKDGFYEADVLLRDGVNYLQVFGIQAIESLRGFDPQCDTWFYIGDEEDSQGIGNAGDQITLYIAAGDDPVAYPQINITYTLDAADAAGTEDDLALKLAAYYNADPVFKVLWRAQRIQGSGCVYISARKPGGQYERPNAGDFNVTSTGTTTVTRAFDRIVRQNKITGLARDPADPRQGQLGIQGSVVQSEGDVTNRFQTVWNIGVNGSVTPVTYTEPADPTEVKFITSITLAAIGNGIQFEQFLSKNSPLDVGLQLKFKSVDVEVFGPFLQTTEDLSDLFAGDPDNFALYIQQGGDKLTAVLNFGVPLEIRPQGEYTVDDYLSITVNDNLSTGITSIRAIVNGFNREF